MMSKEEAIQKIAELNKYLEHLKKFEIQVEDIVPGRVFRSPHGSLFVIARLYDTYNDKYMLYGLNGDPLNPYSCQDGITARAMADYLKRLDAMKTNERMIMVLAEEVTND